jgi:hypothetical protein
LRGHFRPRRLIKMASRENIKVKKLRVSDEDIAGNYVIRILTFNSIITCTIIADAEKIVNCRRRYDIISLSEFEKLAVVLFFSN